MKGYFFTAMPTNDYATYLSGWDRVYGPDDLADFYRPECTDGVFPTADDACQAFVVSGRTVGVKAGYACIEGYRVHVEGDETVEAAGGGHIVIRWDNTAEERRFYLAFTAEVLDTETVKDIELAEVGAGFGVTLTDRRKYVEWVRRPAYYPPEDDRIPYIAWKYIMGLPLTDAETREIEGNSSLMAIINNSRPMRTALFGTKFLCTKQSGKRAEAGETELVTELADLTADYDCLDMLQSDKHTLVIPVSVTRVVVSMELAAGGVNTSALGGNSGGGSVVLQKNGTTVASWADNEVSSAASFTVHETDTVIDVKQGDRLTVQLNRKYGSSDTPDGWAVLYKFKLEVVD